MSESIIRDNYFLFYSVILGISVTVLYDVLRIFRRVFKHKDALVSIEDFIYWIIVAISVFYMMHTENNGTLRWFAVLGAAVGMLLYKKTLSTPLVNIASKGLSALIKIAGKFFHVLLAPVRFLADKCKKGAKMAGHKGGRGMRSLKKKLTRCIKTLRMVLCKQ